MKIRLLIAAFLMSFATSAMAVVIPIDGTVVSHNGVANPWGLSLWDDVKFVADTSTNTPSGAAFEQLPILTLNFHPDPYGPGVPVGLLGMTADFSNNDLLGLTGNGLFWAGVNIIAGLAASGPTIFIADNYFQMVIGLALPNQITPPVDVPEPGTMSLALMSLGLLGLRRLRKAA